MQDLIDAVPVLGKKHPELARWMILAVALLAPCLISPFGNSWIRTLDFAMLYVMLAIGLNLVVGFAGLLDLGYIAFYAVGAYSYAFLASPHFGIHWPFWMILPIAAACAALAGIILGLPTLKLRGDYLAIVTLGFGEIVRIFMNNLSQPINITNGPQGIDSIDSLVVFGVDLSRKIVVTDDFSIPSLYLYYYAFLICVAASIWFMGRLQVSRIGRSWAAIRDDELAAKSVGINTRNMKLLAFSLGATFGGVAGGLFASFQNFISPESFSLMESIAVLTMVVFGGMGNVAGVIVGALLISALPELLRHISVPIQQQLFGHVIVDAEILRMLLLSLSMIFMMLIRPAGIIPAHSRHSKPRLLTGGNA